MTGYHYRFGKIEEMVASLKFIDCIGWQLAGTYLSLIAPIQTLVMIDTRSHPPISATALKRDRRLEN